MFPLISSITQQQQQHFRSSFTSSPQPANLNSPSKPSLNPPSKNPSIKKSFHQKNLASSFSESFISSGKQGGGATVLGEEGDIGTRETCVPTSLNINNVGKAVVVHFA
jgi:hypothetical protein